MTKWATVSDGVARRVTATKSHPDALPVTYDPPDACRVENEVRQKPISEWIVGRDAVAVTYDVMPRDLAKEKLIAKDRARVMRKQVERGGIVFDGVPVATNEKAQARIAGMVSLLLSDTKKSAVDFEARPGEWVKLDRNAALNLGRAVTGHVQACMTHCKKMHDKIDKCKTVSDVWALDVRNGWPEVTADGN